MLKIIILLVALSNISVLACNGEDQSSFFSQIVDDVTVLYTCVDEDLLGNKVTTIIIETIDPITLNTTIVTGVSSLYGGVLERVVINEHGATKILSSSVSNGIVISNLTNSSARGYVNANNVVILGFVIEGNSGTSVAIVGKGPSLFDIDACDTLYHNRNTIEDRESLDRNVRWKSFQFTSIVPTGLCATLYDPKIQIFKDNVLLDENDNWETAPFKAVVPTELQPTDRLESLLSLRLPQGKYTAVLSSVDGSVGTGVIELYQLDNILLR